jgi:hypothetical protein
MKRIVICQSDNVYINVLDNDNSPLQDYTKEISSIMELSNIAILETSQGNVILRPSKILSIQVYDEVELPEQIINKDKNPTEDSITDL